MAANERTSSSVASIASRGLDDPASLTLDEIRTVCASCLTQAPDKRARHEDWVGAIPRAPGAHAVYNGIASAPGMQAILEALCAPNKLGDAPTLSSVLRDMDIATEARNPLFDFAAFAHFPLKR